MTSPASSFNNSGGKVKMVAGYALQQRLGSGSFATVYKGVKVASGEQQEEDAVAIKAITRTSEKLTKKVLENLEMEISILRTYRHPNIVCLHEVQKTERHFYLILEYCGGGDVQRLIRTRKAGRLTERLTRRLLRDLQSGLSFLWGQELIHRDIKPQNLLLTGPLPLDELHDPAKMDAHEQARHQANFPSEKFALKIADFGFARHLQTASLAETLCGSPLYMAPEILQHHRYDAKADLWSVGTVLFEMISGRPPFHGENHIDLLRNIQRKAVRLPPDVRVSKECVNLLRLLLNRNPLSRAGFKEFFDACNAFVALGCEGTSGEALQQPQQQQQQYPQTKMDLGTIHEVDPTTTHGAASMVTVATHGDPSQQQQQAQQQRTLQATPPPALVSPPLGPSMAQPPERIPLEPKETPTYQSRAVTKPYHGFAPLEPSPPSDGLIPNQYTTTTTTKLPFMDSRLTGRPQMPPQAAPFVNEQQQLRTSPVGDVAAAAAAGRNESSQNSSGEESEFVMVERGDSQSPSTSVVRTTPTSSRYYVNTGPVATASSSRGDSYLVVNDAAKGVRVPKGMLSTSPNTGGLLVEMVGGGAPSRLLNDSSSTGGSTPVKVEARMETTKKMLTAAEDVGRRAVSVAHLGDTRAYVAMRLVMMNEEGCSSILSSAPMEGVEEEKRGGNSDDDEHSSAAVTDCEEEESSTATELAGRGRRNSVSSDKSMPDAKQIEDGDDEEMPFAIASPQSPPKVSAIPVRMSASSLPHSQKSSASKPIIKPSPRVIQSHFGEALSCYLKALSMLKGSVNAAQRVMRELESMIDASLTAEQRNGIKNMLKRCEVTSTWLSGQFTGVLERADAANTEIGKLPSSQNLSERNEALPVVSVEELIYNHALACGRDGAVKQLLGQYEAARSCYRSAGLLAEALLMEPKLGREDRNVLEGYVDGFAARITELDEVMLQQSRSVASSGGAGSSLGLSKRGSGVIGLIGGITPPTTGYDVVGSMRRPLL